MRKTSRLVSALVSLLMVVSSVPMLASAATMPNSGVTPAPAVTKIQVALGVNGLPICKSSVKASHPDEAVLSGLTLKLMDVNKTTVYSTYVISDADFAADTNNGGTNAFSMAVPEWKDGSTYVLTFSTVPNLIQKPADAKIVYATGQLDTDSSGTVTKVIGVDSPVIAMLQTVKLAG